MDGASVTDQLRPARPRLDHVDAMRPVKQLGVLSTHALMFFAPNLVWMNASITLLHVSREGFLFISACMLTYAYYDITRKDLVRFWRRRLLAVALPYTCWTIIYFAIGLGTFHGSAGAALRNFGYLWLTGYFQLYFLVVLMQFYVVFPLVVWLLRKTSRHHWAVLMISLGIQLLYTSLVHWQLLPEGTIATREVISYQFYLVAGCLAAIHYDVLHSWIVNHVRLIVVSTIVTAAFAEAWFWVWRLPGWHFLTSPDDAFQPVVIPFNVAAIALIYVAGVALVSRRRSKAVRHATMVGSDTSYAIYLSQVVFLQVLADLGWRNLEHVVPWPFAVAGSVAIVFLVSSAFSGIVGRTPLAMPLAGRHQVSWRSLEPYWARDIRRRMRSRAPGAVEPRVIQAR